MAFENIRREEFDQCGPPPLGLHRLMVEQVEYGIINPDMEKQMHVMESVFSEAK